MDPAERFLTHVEVSPGPLETDCWIWTASGNEWGYGQFKVGGKLVLAHRWAYERWVGPIPKGLDLDHLCRVRRCVRPEHLEPTTRAENLRRGAVARITHCPRGHEYTADNLVRRKARPNARECAECNRQRARRNHGK